MQPHFHRTLTTISCLLTAFSLRAADKTNVPLPRADPNGNPIRRAPTGHVSNYDEAKVGNYTLPDPLVLANGKPVRDAKTWFEVRRPELLKLYDTKIYGAIPANAPHATAKVIETDTNALGGFAIHKDVAIHFGDGADAPVAHLHIYLPPSATKPVQLLLHMVFFSNPPFADATTNAGATARRFKYAAPAGNIGINVGVAAPIAYFPFSGWKASFFGDLHAQGRDGVEFYTEKKVVVERWL